MSRVYYNKLVRDGIKAKIENNGESCEVRELTSDSEFQQELLKKVIEEAGALARVRTREEFMAEYADLMVVLDALTKQLEISPAEIQLTIEENIKQKGKYNNRYFLHWSSDVNYKSNESPQGIK